MPAPFGFAIVGCGMIARFHARAIAEIPGTRVAALVSRTPANAEKLIAETGIAAVPVFAHRRGGGEGARASTRSSSRTPSGAAPGAGRRRRGRRASTSSSRSRWKSRRTAATAIIDACDKHGVKLCTIFPSPVRRRERRRSRRRSTPGRFGRLTLGETDLQVVADAGVLRRGRLEGHAGPRRRRRPDEPGHPQRRSAPLDDGRRRRTSPASPPRSPTSGSRSRTRPSPCLRFKNGALGVIQATTSVHPGYPKTIAIHGDQGSAVIEQDDVLRWDFTPETDADEAMKERFAAKVGAQRRRRRPEGDQPRGPPPATGRLRGGDPRQPPAEGGRPRRAAGRSALIRAVYESMGSGRTTEVR